MKYTYFYKFFPEEKIAMPKRTSLRFVADPGEYIFCV